MSNRSRSFDRAAALYAAARPDYPVDAVTWLLPASAHRVLDLGAGTGKLTRQLVDRGLAVVAVEPSPEMGAELADYVPEAELHLAGAEAIPLPDGSIDAVLVAQAFHWFDQDRAVPEITRVLRPGGRLGLLWNVADDSEPWVAALADSTETVARASDRGTEVVDGDFGDVATAEFRNERRSDGGGLRRLIQTSSAYLVQDEQGRADLVRRIDELVSTHPDLAGRDSFVLPYITSCWRGNRR